MNIHSFNAHSFTAQAQQQAVAGQAEAASAAREATAAREHARVQAQMIRDQAQMMRDAQQMRREVFTVPPMHEGPSPRQEKMMFAGFVIVVLAAVVILQPLMRAFARRLETGARKGEALDTSSADRLQRIEQAVDAMAIEIERISEGQRFTTKLLSARADQLPR
jgi:hypothetical protein